MLRLAIPRLGAQMRSDKARVARKPNLATLDVGAIRHFGTLDLGTGGLTSGWAIPEDAHTWNYGYDSVLECCSKSLSSGCTVEYSGRPFFCDGVYRQDVYFYINGFHMGFWRLTEPKDHILTEKIEPEQ